MADAGRGDLIEPVAAMHDVDRPAAGTEKPQRSALALGLVGGLGEELLAALMSAQEKRSFTGTITDDIGLWKSGPGTLTLTQGENSFTGGVQATIDFTPATLAGMMLIWADPNIG